MTNEQLALLLLNLADDLESEVQRVDSTIKYPAKRHRTKKFIGKDKSIFLMPISMEEAETSPLWEVKENGDAVVLDGLRNRIAKLRQRAAFLTNILIPENTK